MKSNEKMIFVGLVVILGVSASFNGILIAWELQSHNNNSEENRYSWEERCRGIDYSDWIYVIENILPLCKEINEVKTLVNNSNDFSLLVKLDPWEVNEKIKEYPGLYIPLFGINETDDIWWEITYSLDNSPVWTHNLIVYINERTHENVTRTISVA